MALLPKLYYHISKTFEYDLVKKAKEWLRPLKHKIFGANGIYQVIEFIKNERQRAKKEVTTVFDIGAAVGDTAQTFLKNFPRATVYCFEPFPDSFARLKKRTKQFGDRIKLFNVGLYSEEGTREMYTASNHSVNSLYGLAQYGFEEQRKKIILVRTLDSVVREYGITHIDFMKIDVEGAEKDVLAGGREALRMTDNVFIELLPFRQGVQAHDYIDACETLYKAGFAFGGIFTDFYFTKTNTYHQAIVRDE